MGRVHCAGRRVVGIAIWDLDGQRSGLKFAVWSVEDPFADPDNHFQDEISGE